MPVWETESCEVHNWIISDAVALPSSSHAANDNANTYSTSGEAAEPPPPEEVKPPTPPPPPPKGNTSIHKPSSQSDMISLFSTRFHLLQY